MSKLAAVVLVASATIVPALASDRAPTAEERTAIEAQLRSQGYVTWKSIELDDGVWEIDDAALANGEVYDVKLAPNSYALQSRERDDD